MGIGCRLYFEDRNMKGTWPYQRPVVTPRCKLDEHSTTCAGLLNGCDKEPRVCPDAVMQGPEAFCRKAEEIRDCAGDLDRCDLVCK